MCRWSARNWYARLWTWSKRLPRRNTTKNSGRNLEQTSSWASLRITPTGPAWPSCCALAPPTAKPCWPVWSSTWSAWRRSRTRSTSWLVQAGRRWVSHKEVASWCTLGFWSVGVDPRLKHSPAGWVFPLRGTAAEEGLRGHLLDRACGWVLHPGAARVRRKTLPERCQRGDQVWREREG